MNQKNKGHYTHDVWVEDGTVLLANDDDPHYVQEFDSLDEIESFISELRTEAQKAFSSNKSDIEFTIGPVPELVIKIDSVGKIFGKGGRFIGTLTEEELKLFNKAVEIKRILKIDEYLNYEEEYHYFENSTNVNMK